MLLFGKLFASNPCKTIPLKIFGMGTLRGAYSNLSSYTLFA